MSHRRIFYNCSRTLLEFYLNPKTGGVLTLEECSGGGKIGHHLGSCGVKQVWGEMGHFVTFQSIMLIINRKETVIKSVIGQLNGDNPLVSGN